MIRCFVIIRKWLVGYYTNDFVPCPQLRAMLLAFIRKAQEHPHVTASARDLRIIQQLRTCIQTLRRQYQPSDQSSGVAKHSSLMFTPGLVTKDDHPATQGCRTKLSSLLIKARISFTKSLPRDTSTYDRLMDVSPMLIAEQLCIIEQELLAHVIWEDLVKWPHDKAIPSIHNVVERFNLSCQYFTRELTRWSMDKARQGQLISHLIRVASACREMRNYSAMLQVVLGIQTANINHFPPALKKTWDSLEAFASPLKNWGHIRSVMDKFLETPHQIKGPAIPFLGVYLSDITYTFELPTFITSSLQTEKIIKFDKFRTLAKIIRKIQDFQTYSQYSFQKHPVIYPLCHQLDCPYI
ncbi:Guanine nucleotide exchange factor lte1 [Entomophthora muscae]|uniref:Guanine nucleotide exchange factor lte1 n=1 Tax=Entomophthora muscae TaxID=34485 RepID=A0ACC2U2Y4_9FUNG|nr:Guanine nucleotide exchange factor lte1 [Entomophthora muscae]